MDLQFHLHWNSFTERFASSSVSTHLFSTHALMFLSQPKIPQVFLHFLGMQFCFLGGRDCCTTPFALSNFPTVCYNLWVDGKELALFVFISWIWEKFLLLHTVAGSVKRDLILQKEFSDTLNLARKTISWNACKTVGILQASHPGWNET